MYRKGKRKINKENKVKKVEIMKNEEILKRLTMPCHKYIASVRERERMYRKRERQGDKKRKNV